MKILYIDAEFGGNEPDIPESRKEFLTSAGHKVETTSTVRDIPFKDYDLIVILLGKENSYWDLRPEIEATRIYLTRQTNILFAGFSDKEKSFATKYNTPFCLLNNLSNIAECDRIVNLASAYNGVWCDRY